MFPCSEQLWGKKVREELLADFSLFCPSPFLSRFSQIVGVCKRCTVHNSYRVCSNRNRVALFDALDCYTVSTENSKELFMLSLPVLMLFPLLLSLLLLPNSRDHGPCWMACLLFCPQYTAFLWLLLETITNTNVVPPSFKPDREIECIVDKDLSEATNRIRDTLIDAPNR